jgi:hypothetical protein
MTAPHSLDDLVLAIRENHGLVAIAAADLGITRQALQQRIQRSARLQAALAEAREVTTDHAESALFRQIEAGEGWAVCFYLKTQGRSRGYIEHQGVDLTTGGAPLDLATLVTQAATLPARNGQHRD